MRKLLWHSNAPYAPTGYGNQTGLFAPKLAEYYDLAISSFYGLEGARIRWDGIPVFPGLGGTFGNEFLVSHAKDWFGGDPRGGLVVSLMDVWVLEAQMAQQLNLACWVPVDHEPAPPPVVDFFTSSGATPIAMSRFGERLLGRLDPLYVPHGVDTKVYAPRDKAEVRREVGIPNDIFLIGMVAANKGRPSRKGFQQALMAFRDFQLLHDDAFLYLHTVASPMHAQGEDIPALIQALNIPKGRILIADQYRQQLNPLSADAMAKVYSAMDVLVNPALGEGFGIPVIEAQACGVPVIVTNFSAMQEVAGSGWKVKCRPLWTGQNSWMATPDVDDIGEAFRSCYAQSAAGKKVLSDKAREHALQYDVDRVFEEYMLPALQVIEQRFALQEPVTIPARKRVAA